MTQQQGTFTVTVYQSCLFSFRACSSLAHMTCGHHIGSFVLKGTVTVLEIGQTWFCGHPGPVGAAVVTAVRVVTTEKLRVVVGKGSLVLGVVRIMGSSRRV